MAKINLVFCDLCKRVSLKDFEHYISLYNLKSKDGEVAGDICDKCYTSLVSKIERDVDVSKFSLPSTTQAVDNIDENPSPPKKLADGETIVPSRVDNVKPLPSKQECSHPRSSFEPPGQLVCHDCKEVWEA